MSSPALGRLSNESFRQMHRRAISDKPTLRRLLETARDQDAELANGIDRHINERAGKIVRVEPGWLELDCDYIDPERQPQVFFHFVLSGHRYFFAGVPLPQQPAGATTLRFRMPSVIYEAERRELPRDGWVDRSRSATRVSVWDGAGHNWVAPVLDESYSGLGIALNANAGPKVGSPLILHFLDGSRRGETAHATVRHRSERGGSAKLGLEVTSVPIAALLPVERRNSILTSCRFRDRARLGLEVASATVARISHAWWRPEQQTEDSPHVVEYQNQLGQTLRAIVDRTGERGGTAVVIPPAWGRTKETLLPLAATLVATFKQANLPLTVIRFDGTNRRGESYIDWSNRQPGREYLGFRFSQAVKDIEATVDFACDSPEIGADHVVLVTFSLASVEGRRVASQRLNQRLDGWVSVVGMVDLHSGLRSASGGVDFAYGLSRGVSFGRQEIAGVVADMDVTGGDALDHRLGLFEDARRDMAQVKMPVTWIHGRHDGWIDLDRVRTLMSAGETAKRRLLEVPTGHQLRSSQQAIDTFQLVSQEVGRMVHGRFLEPATPDLARLESRRRAELDRRPHDVDLHAFWESYLVGQSGLLGMEILTATSAYRELMNAQVEALDLAPGHRVLDLGAGNGDFPLAAARAGHHGLSVTCLDFVEKGLRRTQSRVTSCGFPVSCLRADLNLSGRFQLPIAPASCDAVLCSLVLGYVSEAKKLLQEVFRLLRPGGRIVVSTPMRDADLSKIYVEGIAELQEDRVTETFGEKVAASFGALQRDFLNAGARLLQLEEDGYFTFWDSPELEDLLSGAGFSSVSSRTAFGDPPQVAMACGVKL